MFKKKKFLYDIAQAIQEPNLIGEDELLWSPVAGSVSKANIFVYCDDAGEDANGETRIRIMRNGKMVIDLDKYGYPGDPDNMECMLFPSRKQRNWKLYVDSKLESEGMLLDFRTKVNIAARQCANSNELVAVKDYPEELTDKEKYFIEGAEWLRRVLGLVLDLKVENII